MSGNWEAAKALCANCKALCANCEALCANCKALCANCKALANCKSRGMGITNYRRHRRRSHRH